jgi:uncharacterized protein (TIGR03663 family)
MPSRDPRARRARRPAAAPAPAVPARRSRAVVEPEEASTEGLFTISDRAWLVAGLVILVLGAVLRLYQLENSPFHNDEGVNGWFLTNLMRHGTYAYDPANYHGPTLYYFALVSAILVGLTDVGVRLVPVFFGIATIGFALAMRRWLGTTGSLVAAALLAVSPGWLYFSRYFIHEELLVCFTVAMVYFGLRWLDGRRTRWLLLAAASAALLFATKETAILTVGVLVIALACLPLYERIVRRPIGAPPPATAVAAGPAASSRSARRPREASEGQSLDERVIAFFREPWALSSVIAAVLVFLVVYVLFYSSFGTHWQGVLDSFGSLAIWTTTGTEDHIHSLFSYVEWLLREELPITIVAIVGGLIAVREGRSRLALFVALWAFGLFAAYSLIGYKTPWLLLSFLVPMALIGGYGIDRLWTRLRGSRFLIMAACSLLLVFSTYQAVRLSFSDYDNDANPYVYAHTVRDTYRLLTDVDAAAAKLGVGNQIHVVIMSPDYWPLPWYWRDYPGVGFFGQITGTAEPVVIAKIDQEALLPADFKAAYVRQGEYTLRPGVQLALYFRRDAFGL